MTVNQPADSADTRAQAADVSTSSKAPAGEASHEPTPDLTVTDRLKDKTTQVREAVSEQASSLTKKSAELADQAKHKARELADTARTAAQADQAGDARTTRRAGAALVATASTIGAAILFKKYRQRRAQKNRWSWLQRVWERARRR